MGREHKYRVWFKPEKIMIYLPDMEICSEYSHLGFYPAEDSPYSGIDNLPDPYDKGDKIENYDIMQYTGLKDKNGIMIFEGDRVRWHTWDDYTGSAVVEFKGGKFYPVADYCLENSRFDEDKGFEIIGNIYEAKPD